MDEINFLFNAWKTCLEMARDRGYVINNNYNSINYAEFKYLLQDKNHNIDIICDTNKINESKILYIKFIPGIRIKPSSIKEVFEEIKNKINSNKELELTIILKNEPNNSILKLQHDDSYGKIQILWCKKLQFNITKHELVPKHTKLNDDDSNKLLERYSLQSKFQLPILLRDDPVSKYYNFQNGDIIKITNTKTSHNEKYIFYRCVR